MVDQKAYNQKIIEEFRATRGQPGGPMEGRPIVLLTTTGARSGQQRTTPLMYVRDGERIIVIASNAGAPKHPDWYYNLVAHPDVTVEVGAETYPAAAAVLTGAEYQRLWDQITASNPFFIDHQAKTARQIPLVALARKSG